MKRFTTIINNTNGPIIQAKTWVAAQYKAYSISNNLKITGYTDEEYREDLLAVNVQDILKPRENVNNC